METIALWLGYAVMVAGGVAITATALWLAANQAWKLWIAALGWANLHEAIVEWREKNPERAEKWKRRTEGA